MNTTSFTEIMEQSDLKKRYVWFLMRQELYNRNEELKEAGKPYCSDIAKEFREMAKFLSQNLYNIPTWNEELKKLTGDMNDTNQKWCETCKKNVSKKNYSVHTKTQKHQKNLNN